MNLFITHLKICIQRWHDFHEAVELGSLLTLQHQSITVLPVSNVGNSIQLHTNHKKMVTFSWVQEQQNHFFFFLFFNNSVTDSDFAMRRYSVCAWMTCKEISLPKLEKDQSIDRQICFHLLAYSQQKHWFLSCHDHLLLQGTDHYAGTT